MSDLIKREDAITVLYRNTPFDAKGIALLDKCESEINAIPSADRPQGEWIDRGWHGDWQFETDGRGNCWRVFECSLCNGENTIKTRFCPHCGARMKGADDE